MLNAKYDTADTFCVSISVVSQRQEPQKHLHGSLHLPVLVVFCIIHAQFILLNAPQCAYDTVIALRCFGNAARASTTASRNNNIVCHAFARSCYVSFKGPHSIRNPS